MIERLLEADRLLALGMDQQAEKIYWQAAELDPRNAIAIVGLAAFIVWDRRSKLINFHV